MAKTMKSVQASGTNSTVLVIALDLLSVPRGHRQPKRGGIHKTARKPSRAQAKRSLRREMKHESASRRRRMT
jgi:hypothetical protein